MLAVVAGVGIWTTPNRWGAGIAMHYLSRIFWPDPVDPVPPAVAKGLDPDSERRTGERGDPLT
jgi:hypothetical protein